MHPDPPIDRKLDPVEGQIGRIRAILEAGEIEYELSGRLGMRLEALTPSERPILANAISEVQLQSKLWLLDHLFTQVRSDRLAIQVLGGWCGVLPWLAELTGRGSSAEWTSIDIDPEACSLGKKVFGDSVSRMRFLCDDIYALDYHALAGEKDLIVVNTICEHLRDFPRWRSMMPGGILTVLQSNNYGCCPDHVNCVDSVAELAATANLSRVLFQGSLAMSLFTRYMLIGLT
jgi:hypothetical protein